MSSIYGYVRVSSKDQNEDRQMIAMEEMGVPKDNIYMDKLSGKDFNRADSGFRSVRFPLTSACTYRS